MNPSENQGKNLNEVDVSQFSTSFSLGSVFSNIGMLKKKVVQKVMPWTIQWIWPILAWHISKYENKGKIVSCLSSYTCTSL